MSERFSEPPLPRLVLAAAGYHLGAEMEVVSWTIPVRLEYNNLSKPNYHEWLLTTVEGWRTDRRLTSGKMVNPRSCARLRLAWCCGEP